MRKNTIIKLFGIVLTTLFLAGFVSADHTINYELEFEHEDPDLVEMVAYDCDDSECNQVKEFSGSLPTRFVESPSESDYLTANFPEELENYGYATYFYADGYIPQAYSATWYGNDETDIVQGFEKHETCTAPINDFSIENSVYNNEPLVVEVPAELDGDVQSALDENNRQVNYLPQGNEDDYYDFKQDLTSFYEAETKVQLKIMDKSTNEIEYTDSKKVDIYMSEQENIEFEWSPHSQGDYNVEVSTTVTDSMCETTEERSSSQDLEVLEERASEEYVTLLDGLEKDNEHPKVGESIELGFDHLSYYADQDYEKHPVDTHVEYYIEDEHGSKTYSENLVLKATSDPETFEEESFSWIPEDSGLYTVNIHGEPERENESLDYSSTSLTMEFDVESKPLYDATFQVFEPGSEEKLADVTIVIDNQEEITNEDGKLVFEDLEPGDYNYKASKEGYESSEGSITVEDYDKDISIHLDVENSPPKITGLPSVQMTSNDQRTVNLDDYATDDQTSVEDLIWTFAENENLEIEITDSNDAVISSTDWTGLTEVIFTVEDKYGETDQDSMEVEVTDPNTAPEVSTFSDIELNSDEELRNHYNLQDYITDEETSFENLDIFIDIKGSEDNCGVYEENNYLNIVPESNEDLECSVTVTAKDTEGLSDSSTFDVTINQINEAPKIISSGLPDAEAYSEYQYQLDTDSDSPAESLTFELVDSPEGLKVYDTGILEWDYPTSDNIGSHKVSIRVDDGELDSKETFELNVNEAEEGVPPEAVFDIDKSSGDAPLQVQFDASESYHPEDGLEITEYNWNFGEGGQDMGKVVEYKYHEPGTYIAELIVEDEAGSEGTAYIEIEVTESKLSWTEKPANQTVKANEDFEYNLPEVDYSGESAITWSLSETSEIFELDNNHISADSGGLVGGETHLINVKVSDEDSREVEASFYLDVQKVENPAEDDGSDDSSSNTGNSRISGSWEPTLIGYEEISLDDQINVTPVELDLDITAGEVSNTNLTIDNPEGLNLTSSHEGLGNVLNSAELSQDTIILEFEAETEGIYNGTVLVSNDDQSVRVPVHIEAEGHSNPIKDFYVNIRSDTAYNDSIDFSILVRDEIFPDSEEEFRIHTTLLDSSGDAIMERTQLSTVELVKAVNYRKENVSPGTYTIETEVEYNGEIIERARSTEVIEPTKSSWIEQVTGGFYQTTSSVKDTIQGIIGLVSSIIP